MSEQSWWRRTIAAIQREYERRIRRASLVTEYGAAHHGHGDDHQPDDEVAEIVNVPRGTPVGRSARPEPSPDPQHPPAE